jgi:hypothetical protein
MRNFNALGILGIVIGLLGVAGPIGWDYYKTKSELELQLIDDSPIVEKSKTPTGLRITYAGEPVDELYRATFSIRNSGRTPLLQKDVISPISIQLLKSSKIIEASIVDVAPKNLDASVQFNKADARITVAFLLLNPGDRINVGVLMQSSDIEFSASARIANISEITILSNVKLGATTRRSISWTTYLAGLFSILMMIAGIAAVKYSILERTLKNKFLRNSFSLPILNTKEEYKSYIDSILSFTTQNERKPLHNFIDNLPNSDHFGDSNRDIITKEINSVLTSATPNLPVTLFIFAISGLGAVYVYFSVIG